MAKKPDTLLGKIRGMFWQILLISMVAMPVAVWGVKELEKVLAPNPYPVRVTGIQPDMLITRDFTLTDQRGQTVTAEQFSSKAWVVFFGFTHCPDICPVTLSRLSALWGQIQNKERLQVMFVSVDPERDTPAVVADYMKAFDPSFVGLTGSQVQVDAIKKNFHAYSAKVQEQGASSYTVDHTATVFLLRADGSFAGTLDMDEPDAIALGKLKMLSGEAPTPAKN